jgi:hypothetical protein
MSEGSVDLIQRQIACGEALNSWRELEVWRRATVKILEDIFGDGCEHVKNIADISFQPERYRLFSTTTIKPLDKADVLKDINRILTALSTAKEQL